LPAAPDEPAIRPLVIRKCTFDYLFFALDKRGAKRHGRPDRCPSRFNQVSSTDNVSLSHSTTARSVAINLTVFF
jgi:hypothetical protein